MMFLYNQDKPFGVLCLSCCKTGPPRVLRNGQRFEIRAFARDGRGNGCDVAKKRNGSHSALMSSALAAMPMT